MALAAGLAALTACSGDDSATPAPDAGPDVVQVADATMDAPARDTSTGCTKTTCGTLCTDTQRDVANCGACGTACAAGEACTAGSCVTQCGSGTTTCNGACVDVKVDPAHCGACGTACAAGQVCSNGSCQVSCQAGLTSCTSAGDGGGRTACVNTKSDAQNCGACGTTCGAGQVCANGSCALSCPPGEIACNGGCIDPTLDGRFCGASAGCGAGSGDDGTVCAAGQVCSGGTCQLTCQAGLVDCNGTCIDPLSSNAYCGATGTCGGDGGAPGATCAPGQICSNGTCQLTCQAGLVNCNGTCVDPASSNAYCGATAGCGVTGGAAGKACAAGQVCSGGACQLTCQQGLVNCGGRCVDPTSSNAFCGATLGCGASGQGTAGATCAGGQVCSGGACQLTCQQGLVNCGGRCVDPTSSNAFCGATLGCGVSGQGTAGAACAAGQVCANGACALTCQAGYVNCNGSCVDPAVSNQHCGATLGCGTNGGSGPVGSAGASCAPGQVCSNRLCQLTCQQGLVNCNGTCVDPRTSNAFCGATAGCGTSGGAAGSACAAGEVCTNGACQLTCQAGLVNCNGRCVDPKTSNQFCGATAGCGGGSGSAGTTCPSGNVCANGACGLTCQAGLVNCNGTCVDPTSDRAHCGATSGCGANGQGAAGVACADGQVCSSGACVISCSAGQVACGGTCVDPTSSNAYCGATAGCGVNGGNGAVGSAGAPCASGTVCSGGTCQLSCQAGLVNCGGTCVDPISSRSYCGATDGCGAGGQGTAGTSCTSGQVCSGGTCQLSCQTGLVDCGGTCVDPTTSRQYCGASTGCGVNGQGAAGVTCGNGQVCSSGSCQVSCPSGQIACAGSCVDLLTSPTAGGATAGCGLGGQGSAGAVCASGQACSAGTCAASCASGQVTCGGSCVDPQTNRQYCGASGACTGASAGVACAAGQVCSAGTCTVSCQSGLTSCSNVCTNTAFDPANCGSCGSACSAGFACVSGSCRRATRFSGPTGTSWQVLTIPSDLGGSGLTDYSPPGFPVIYGYGYSTFQRYSEASGTWTPLAAPSVGSSGFESAAFLSDAIYTANQGVIQKYSLASNTWSTPQTGIAAAFGSLVAHDDARNIYVVPSTGFPMRVLKYNTTSNAVSTLTTTIMASDDEPRLVWDSNSAKLYLAPSYSGGTFYGVDPSTGASTALPSHPETYVNDIFCSDRSGHIYAGGSPGITRTMWQYDIGAATWARIVDLPFDKGNSGMCTVTDSGWLYVNDGGTAFARIQLY